MDQNLALLLLQTAEILSASQKAYNFDTDYKNIAQTLEILSQSGLNASPIYNNLVISLYCGNCKKEKYYIRLSCQHRICLPCINSYVCSESGSFINQLLGGQDTLRCPECYVSLLPKDCRKILLKIYPNVLKPNEDEEEAEEKIECKGCGMRRSSNKFYYTCKHLCVFCGLKLLKNGPACNNCGCQAVSQEAAQYRNGIVCSGCNQKKLIPQDYVLEICKDHAVCYDCQIGAWRTLRCPSCKDALEFSALKAIKNQIFATCSNCQNVVERKFMIEKNCCAEDICFFCQKKSGNSNCRNCKAQFSELVIRRLGSLNDIN